MEIEVQNIEIANGDPIVVSIPTITVDSTNENIELAVTRKEFNIIGDSVFIGNRLEDTPQWLLDYIDTLNDLALDDKINSINGLSQSLEDLIVAVDAAKNAYTSAVITYEELELMVNSKIDTLNSSLSGADSTIIEILNTKVTPTEAQTIATTALQASINNGAIGALIGSVQEAIADESSARATEIDVLTAQLDGFDDTYSTALTGLETTVANNSGVISAHSTEFTKLNTAITSGNFDTYGASNFFNTLSSEIDGAVIKAGSNFAYDSTLVIGPYAYNSGFGIKSTGSSGSNVTVDGTSYPLWNSEFWIKADKFKMVAASQSAAAQSPFSVNATTGDITFNGKVSFSSVTGTPTHTSGLLSARPVSAVPGSTYVATDESNKLYTYTATGWKVGGATSSEVVADINAGNTTTIDGGKITADSLLVNSINAVGGIVASSISVGSLSAISSNLGTINAGIMYNSGANESNYAMKIDLNAGEIHIK